MFSARSQCNSSASIVFCSVEIPVPVLDILVLGILVLGILELGILVQGILEPVLALFSVERILGMAATAIINCGH